jgi:hypothetical protein
VLILGPQNFGIAMWTRDERGVGISKITRRDIKPASIAATLARQERQHG